VKHVSISVITEVNRQIIDLARTAVVNVVVLVERGYLFNCRSLNHSIWCIGLFTNRAAIIGSVAMIAAQLCFTYAPVMNKLFHTAPIGAVTWLRIAAVAAASLATVEFEKWVRFGGQRGKPRCPNKPVGSAPAIRRASN
jgi:cation-transporting P-type ATPase F